MKVCTDACILGAWTAKKILGQTEQPALILDVGTGTGLLALMLAQKTAATVHAVEMNPDAAKKAEENFVASPWADRISIFHTAIQEFPHTLRYEWIISNPPFFEDDLTSGDAAKNAAKHDSTLTLRELIFNIRQLMENHGQATLLIPYYRTAYFEDLVKQEGLFVNEYLFVKQSPRHGFFRTLLLLSRQDKLPVKSQMSIHDHSRNYTTEFAELLRDYYLKL